MKRFFTVSFLLVYSFASSQDIKLVPGMKINKSARVAPAVYTIPAPKDGKTPVILIEGNNIEIDFNYSELKGSTKPRQPDQFTGVAIIIRNSRKVTIKNLKANGFKFALVARNTYNLVIENCDFSYNYRPKLNSTQEKEDISDWMSYHHNEKDEWMRYGAAIYLSDCSFPTIRFCTVIGGQNALMMTKCNDGLIVNNSFSFNSGIGIGMYRSSRNRVIYNIVVFNVRGYSHGVYNRGQDSAGMLVYEQSSNNIFYRNRVTHSGDGFFLWAGQTTMDTGEGGCNDNLIYGNDFSYAPTNGIEVTFSRNKIINNRMEECDHGIWGGYSYNTLIRNNQFVNNRIGIAIEHGQDNDILMNIFENNREAVRLWANRNQDPNWIYPKKRDTRSKNYNIHSNILRGNPTGFQFALTDSLNVYNNFIKDATVRVKGDTTVTRLRYQYNDSTVAVLLEADGLVWPDSIAKIGQVFRIVDSTYAGRKNIRMLEWGPYDFRSPIIWNTNPVDTGQYMFFDMIGPSPGTWQIKYLKGLERISQTSGTFPMAIIGQKQDSARIDIRIDIQYAGQEVVTPFGETIAAGKPYVFRYRKFFQPVDWQVDFYGLDTSVHNPIRTGSLFSPVELKKPVKTEKLVKLDYAWWGGLKVDDKKYPQFMTVANGKMDIPAGEYEIGITWDDAVRVYIDDKLVINEWNPSIYTFDESPNKKIKVKLGGTHRLRVEHIELGGFATLSLKIKPVE
jgi:parallel beta-helix repeat protein